MALIVVIEDNADNARLAAKLLRHAGHEVMIAEDGEIGLTTVFAHHPDLVLIDLGLPDIDGQTVVGLVRQQPELKSVPMIAFTAWPEDTAYTMARAYGCDGIITKPMNTRTFVQQIADYMAGKRPAMDRMSGAVPLSSVDDDSDAAIDGSGTSVSMTEPGLEAKMVDERGSEAEVETSGQSSEDNPPETHVATTKE